MWLFAVLILSSVSAFNMTYDSKILAPPGKSISIPIYLFSDSNEAVRMNCLGNVEVFCPRTVELLSGIEKPTYIKLTPKLGENRISFKIGDKEAEIRVLGSNQTTALLASLKKLNLTFNNLEAKYGKNQIIDLAKELIKEGEGRYQQKEYFATQGIVENLNRLLEEYYSQISYTTQEEIPEPAKLNLGFLPIIFIALGLGAYVIKTQKNKPKKENNTEIESLAKIIKNEMGAE